MKAEKKKQELSRYRLKQAWESLEEAEYLLQGKKSPRSVINRAYYAMFYAVLALLVYEPYASSKHNGNASLNVEERVLASRRLIRREKDMGKLVLEMPDDLFEALRLPPEERVMRLRRELAVRLYQKGLLSFGKARELAGMGKWEFYDLLGEEGIIRHYDLEELEEDLKTLEKFD